METLELRRRLFSGEDHSDVAQSLYNLAMFHLGQRQLEGVEQLFNEALSIHHRVFQREHPTEGEYLHGLGILSWLQGNRDRALELFEQALELRRRTLGEHAVVVLSLGKLGEANAALHQHLRAEQMYLEAVELQSRIFLPDDSRRLLTLIRLGSAQIELDKLPQAVEHMQTAADGLRSHPDFGPKHWQTSWAEAQLGRALVADGSGEQGTRLLTKSLKTLSSAFGDADWRPRRVRQWLKQP